MRYVFKYLGITISIDSKTVATDVDAVFCAGAIIDLMRKQGYPKPKFEMFFRKNQPLKPKEK